MEWLARLGPKLRDRQDAIAYWRRYYEGHHDLPTGPNQHKDAFERFQRKARTNLCLLCAESMVHRTVAIGFRDSKWTSPEPDPVWTLWQDAKLDARQFGIWRKAYSRGSAYVTVGADPRNTRRPRVTIEGPENVIVETDPADSARRLAALRLWHDSIARRWMATLYLPGERYHWQTTKQYKKASEYGRSLSWRPEAWEARAEPARSLREVPVIPFLNGDEGETPRAEFDAGIDVQDRLNLTVLNRLSSERYAAFRQTLLLNYEADEDPVTGEKIAPWKPGVTQIGTIPPGEPGDPPVTVVQLQQTDTTQMLRGVEADMRAFAAITLTPVYYLPGDLVNIGADSVAALDAGHNAKVKQRHATWGESLEEMLQLMTEVADLDRDLTLGEMVWARPENLIPAQVADYLSKMVAAKIPLEMAVEEIGWSPQRVEALRSAMASEAVRASLAAPPPPPAVAPPAFRSAEAEQAEL
jgi:hypothetical protein